MEPLVLAEWSAVICGVLYLTLAIRENRTGWIFGGISTGIYVFIMYHSRLFADMLLNIFYTMMAIKGWIYWGKPGQKLSISVLSKKSRILMIVWMLGFTAVLGYFFRTFTRAEYPFTDSFVTSTAVAATWLSARKKLESWPVWIVSNGTAVVLFYVKGLFPTVFLTLIYLTLALAGWITWIKRWRRNL